jgi:Flp pilus assembly protein TadB
MNTTTIAVACGALFLVGAFAIVRAFRPAPLTLRAVRARVATQRPVPPARAGSRANRLGIGLAGGPLGRIVDERLGRAMRLSGYTVPTVIGQTILTAAVTALAMTLAVATLIAAGFVSASLWIWLLVPLVTALFTWRVIADVRARAIRRHSELQRVMNDFVQLLAVALTTNRSVEDAISFAADAGDGYGFDLLRQTINTAQPMGITVWDALNSMADTYDLPEMRGLTTSLQRQAGVGVSVAATIRTEAKAMRAKQLVELTDRADKANANLSLPTMGMVFGMVLFLAYPIMQQIADAFT